MTAIEDAAQRLGELYEQYESVGTIADRDWWTAVGRCRRVAVGLFSRPGARETAREMLVLGQAGVEMLDSCILEGGLGCVVLALDDLPALATLTALEQRLPKARANFKPQSPAQALKDLEDAVAQVQAIVQARRNKN